MKKTLKILTAFLSVISILILSATAYGDIFLPDLISTCNDEVRFNFLFTARTGNDITAFSVSETPQCEDEATIKLLEAIPVKKVVINKTGRRYVAPGGELIGVTLKTEGVLVVGTENFLSNNSTVSPATEAGLKTGDIILKANGETISTNAQLTKIIEGSNGEKINIEYKRENKTEKTFLQPRSSDLTSTFRCGLWIRDCTNGIGTLTYTDIENGTIASLGHGIYDVDTKQILPSSGGKFKSAILLGVTKGNAGAAGELRGMIGEKDLGELAINCDCGIYGKLISTQGASELVPVASRDEVKSGAAQIITTIDNEKKQGYDIEIERIDYSTSKSNKNMIIKITDAELLEKTGGIVQGMSGSPIIQNGMLIGAVTHVFLNDPQKGYAIFAENMLELSDSLCIEPAA